MRARWVVCALTWAALAAARPVHAAESHPLTFALEVSPRAGAVTDRFVATVEIVLLGVAGAERFVAPEFADFTIIDQRAQQSTEWAYDPVRGQEIRNREVRSFVLAPRRAGRLSVGAARIVVGGLEHATSAVVVQVAAAGDGQAVTAPTVAPPPEPAPSVRTFLHAAVDRTRVYVGEQVTANFTLYTRDGILRFDPAPLRLDDFWPETLVEPQTYLTYADELLGGRTWAVATVARRALFPIRAGQYALPRLTARITTEATPFGTPLTLVAPEPALEVLPLPPGAPVGFDPAYVGSFTLSAELDRPSAQPGQPVTLTVVVKGTGAIRRAGVPELAFDGFDVLRPRDFDEQLALDAVPIGGERRYRYVLTPRRGGLLAVGPIELAYFEPRTARYQVARSAAMTLRVVGDPAPGATASDVNAIGRELRPAHELAGLTPRVAAQAHRSPFFLGLLLAPPGLFLLVVVLDRVRERLRRETPRARLRRARGRVRRTLHAAELHVRAGRTAKFHAEIARALYDRLADHLGEPVTAMTRERLSVFLAECGFPEPIVAAIAEELEVCDFARFAQSAAGPGEMRATLRRMRTLLREVERVRIASGRSGAS